MKIQSFIRTWTLLLAAGGFSVACGGSLVPVDGSAADSSPDAAGGGSGIAEDDGVAVTGGAPAAGGVPGAAEAVGTGGSATTGGGGAPTGTGGAPTMCCMAAATCDAGDQQIESADDCPNGRSCYSRSICCDTVWCMKE